MKVAYATAAVQRSEIPTMTHSQMQEVLTLGEKSYQSYTVIAGELSKTNFLRMLAVGHS